MYNVVLIHASPLPTTTEMIGLLRDSANNGANKVTNLQMTLVMVNAKPVASVGKA